MADNLERRYGGLTNRQLSRDVDEIRKIPQSARTPAQSRELNDKQSLLNRRRNKALLEAKRETEGRIRL